MSILLFAIVLNTILADLKIAKKKKYQFDIVVKILIILQKKCFDLPKKYKYIAD